MKRRLLEWKMDDREAYKSAMLGIIILALSGVLVAFKYYALASFFVVLAIFELQLAANYFSNKKIVELLERIEQKLSILLEEKEAYQLKEKVITNTKNNRNAEVNIYKELDTRAKRARQLFWVAALFILPLMILSFFNYVVFHKQTALQETTLWIALFALLVTTYTNIMVYLNNAPSGFLLTVLVDETRKTNQKLSVLIEEVRKREKEEKGAEK